MWKSAVIFILSMTVSKVLADPPSRIPASVMKYIQEQVKKQCHAIPENIKLQAPTKEKTSKGWIYTADFSGAPENYLIVVESDQKLEVEDINCPGESSPLVAF